VDFLNGGRARAWCRILAAMLAVWLVMQLASFHAGKGDAIGADFVSYWTAARMAVAGHAAQVYDKVLHAQAEHAALIIPAGGYYPFFYPPIWLLACLPLALLPYWWSLAGFTLAGLAAFVAAIRRLLPPGWGVLPVLAFPAVIVTAGTGQNGFFTASLFGFYIGLVEKRPVLAGVCLGGLAYKPHLAVAIPVALLAARRWRLTAVTGGTACALAALAWLVFGSLPWLGFLHGVGDARAMIEGDMLDQTKMQGAFTAARLLHAGVGVSYAAQATVALCILATLAFVCARRPGAAAEGAVAAAAAMLCTPYLVDYDLPCLAPPMAWVAADACRGGWRAGEKPVLLTCYLLPLAARGVALQTGIVLAPFVIGALFVITVRRALAQRPC
jgi:hypothetical protein